MARLFSHARSHVRVMIRTEQRNATEAGGQVHPMVTILARMGIEKANCETCSYLGSDDDGNYAEFAISWPVCTKFPRYQYLKSFPFKKEMTCWSPEFWHSKFANIVNGSDESMAEAAIAFKAAKEA